MGGALDALHLELRRVSLKPEHHRGGLLTQASVLSLTSDGTRLIEIYHVRGLPHAEGMLVAYLPNEQILAYADMFNAPPADQPVPNPPVVGTKVFLDNIERLKLEPEKIMSVANESRRRRKPL